MIKISNIDYRMDRHTSAWWMYIRGNTYTQGVCKAAADALLAAVIAHKNYPDSFARLSAVLFS
jgi:hypothetical protein